jgi:CRISPR-associated endonuclease/helicase Cas3
MIIIRDEPSNFRNQAYNQGFLIFVSKDNHFEDFKIIEIFNEFKKPILGVLLQKTLPKENIFAHFLKPEFFARPTKNTFHLQSWQTLYSHSMGVRKLAGFFAESFGCKEWGEYAGMIHDLGKYLPRFQAKLYGENISVEHSGVGACFAKSNRSASFPFETLAVMFAVAGHHGGLPSKAKNYGGRTCLKDRITRNEKDTELIKQIADDFLPQISVPQDGFFKEGNLSAHPDITTCRRAEFFTRMLFSCLVDADRLDAERFSEKRKSDLRGSFSSIQELKERLDVYIRNIPKKQAASDAEKQVDQVRAYVLALCIKAASIEPGLFSLTVPTGGGKTLSGMAFALRHAEQYRKDRVIVVIPYTSIIEQNAAVYREALGEENVLEHHSNIDPEKYEENAAYATRQELAAENWDARVIVTTTVQFFESLHAASASRCRKLHNIANSVIILDEVQTLPPSYLEPIVDVLGELSSNYRCSIVLSTATPPALQKRPSLSVGLENIRPIIPESACLGERLRRTRYIWPKDFKTPVTWKDLAADLKSHPRVLSIVHRRKDARILAEMLPPEGRFHLSALMCPAHRRVVLDAATRILTSDETSPCRLVATQLVEAGVHIDFPVVFRALAGLDSIVQAGGRCNRNGKNPNKGDVFIFRAPTDPPAPSLRAAAEVTERLLQEKPDMDLADPKIFDEYFQRFYFLQSKDVKSILSLRQNFDFPEVESEFRLIEDGFTKTIIVPYGNGASVIERIRREGPTRQNLRMAQPFTVSIPEQAFRKMNDGKENGAVFEEIYEGVYALSCLHPELYSDDYGLVISDEPPSLIDPEKLLG